MCVSNFGQVVGIVEGSAFPCHRDFDINCMHEARSLLHGLLVVKLNTERDHLNVLERAKVWTSAR